MKHIVSITTITCFLMGFTVDAQGADKQEYTIVGIGSQSCGSFIISRDKAKRSEIDEVLSPYLNWLTGYLTAATMCDSRIIPLIEKEGVTEQYHWMINYCQQHPLDDFSTGSEQLLGELIRRSINEPANITPHTP